MALVIRSKRDFDFIPKIKSHLGPGEYEKEFNITDNNIFHRNVPFNSSKERTIQNFNKENNELGPGSYFKENHNSLIINSFSRHSIKNIIEKKLYDISLFHLMKKKKDQQMKEKKSIIIDKNNSYQVNNIKSRTNYKKNNNNKKYIKIIPTTLTKNRLNSIPSKKNYLGYYYDENGLPIMLEDNINNNDDNNNKNNKLSINLNKMSENDEFIMASYLKNNMIKKKIMKNSTFNFNKTQNNNTNNSTNYNCSTNNSTNRQFNKQSNMSLTDRSSNVMLTNKYINSVEHSNNSNNNSFLSNNNSNCHDNLSLFINKSLSHKKMPSKVKGFLYKLNSKNNKIHNKIEDKKIDINNINNLSDSEIQDIVYKTLLKVEPGPGYYQNISTFDKYQLISKKNKKYNFGSNEKRNLNLLNKNANKDIGPGSYFKNDSQKKIIKKNFSTFYKTRKFTKKKLNEPKELEDFFSKTETLENIGPGTYEFKSQFSKRQKDFSGPFEKRFFNIEKENSPGPGEYLPLNDWGKKAKVKMSNYINKFIFERININQEKGRDYFIPKSNNPDVGAYNPQILNSIEYNMIFKNNKISNFKAPFFSSEEKYRHKYNSTPEIIGPGSYININNSLTPKNNSIKNGKYNFKQKNIDKSEKIKDLYLKYKQKTENKIGPGAYDNYNYYDWNKRSFNVLYV